MTAFFVRSRPTTNWAASTAYGLGDRRKATAAARGIHFEVTTAGTSGGTEPSWNTTVGGTTSDGSVTWTTRGSAANWAASTAYVSGDRVVATTSATAARQALCFECTTGGTTGGSEPAWNTTIGGTTTDNTVTWTTRACTTWDNAHIRIQANMASGAQIAAGDTVYIGDEHFQTQATGLDLTCSAGTRTNPLKFICVQDTGDPATPTTLANTAVVEMTGSDILRWQSGFAYIYGLIMRVGAGASASSINFSGNAGWIVEACALRLIGTSAGSSINVIPSGSAGYVKWVNTTVQFAAVGHGIVVGEADFEWKDTPGALVLGTVPTALFKGFGPNDSGTIKVHGIDLANLSTALIDLTEQYFHHVDVYNCKMHASAVFTTGTPQGVGGQIRVINCDSGATNTNLLFDIGQGTLSEELTIVRTGGASDGTTPFAWKIVTRATTPRFDWPFFSLPIVLWNDTTGASKTATVEIVNDGVTLKDDEVWAEVEYLGTSGFPVASFIDDAKADILATAANQASSAVAWTTTGLTTPVKQKLQVSFTPQLKGPVIVRVYVARPSTTLYVDPLVSIT